MLQTKADRAGLHRLIRTIDQCSCVSGCGSSALDRCAFFLADVLRGGIHYVASCLRVVLSSSMWASGCNAQGADSHDDAHSIGAIDSAACAFDHCDCVRAPAATWLPIVVRSSARRWFAGGWSTHAGKQSSQRGQQKPGRGASSAREELQHLELPSLLRRSRIRGGKRPFLQLSE